MLTFALKRLAIAVPTLFFVVSLSFFLMHLAPGGPFDAEANLEPQVIENLKAAYNLDKPLISQYLMPRPRSLPFFSEAALRAG